MNTLDVMHIERNVSANVMAHLFGEKDTPAMRMDMESIGKFPHLWLRPASGSTHFLQPRAPYIFTDSEKRAFMALVANTRTPFGYCSNL